MTTLNDKRVFWGCFIALIATAFGFIVRTQVMNEWGEQFHLSETQKGEIFGVGLWPFAISIVLFSLVIDRIGYGRSMVFAFICHVASAIITICAPLVLAGPDASSEAQQTGYTLGYYMLYIGNFVVALGNGTVEAVINPVVATMFSKEKTKWLNILHAGWPGGLVLGGILAIGMGSNVTLDLGSYVLSNWQLKVCLLFIPVIAYAILLIGCKFPVHERVASGVSYRDMLKEVGFLGALIIVSLIVRELGRVFNIHWTVQVVVGAVIVLGFTAYVRSIGRFMFFFLLIIMIPLAITELGTDSWITDLMQGGMSQLNLNPGWVLVYTSFIMLVLRFFAGPIVHRLSPLGLLALSSAVAAIGLICLGLSSGWLILVAATLYGFGKTFFWPTMLGVAAEQFPKGGALTLNVVGGVGMLSVGIIGASMLGYLQDTRLGSRLETEQPAVYSEVIASEEKMSVFGPYLPLNDVKVAQLPPESKEILDQLRNTVRKNVLFVIALLPTFMLVCYLGLIFYFKSKGGYKAEVLAGHAAEDEEFTGGVEGPVR